MDIRDDLKAYLDGELPAEGAEVVRAAIESDAELRRLAEQFTAVNAALTADKREYEPVGLEQTLAALAPRGFQVAPVRPKKSYLGYWIGLGLAAGATVIWALPAYLGGAHLAAKSTLASASMAKRSLPDFEEPRARSLSAAKSVGPNTVTGGASLGHGTTPPNLARQIQEDQKQIEFLKAENARLKHAGVANAAASTAPQKPMTGELQFLPPVRPDFATQPAEPQGAVEAPAHGIPTGKVASFERQVRSLVENSGGRLERAYGPGQLRTLVFSITQSKANAVQEKLKALLKSAGQMSLAPYVAPPASPDEDRLVSRLRDLKLQRERLLIDYLPEAPSVREIDAEIKEAQAKLDDERARERAANAKLVGGAASPGSATLTVVIG